MIRREFRMKYSQAHQRWRLTSPCFRPLAFTPSRDRICGARGGVQGKGRFGKKWKGRKNRRLGWPCFQISLPFKLSGPHLTQLAHRQAWDGFPRISLAIRAQSSSPSPYDERKGKCNKNKTALTTAVPARRSVRSSPGCLSLAPKGNWR